MIKRTVGLLVGLSLAGCAGVPLDPGDPPAGLREAAFPSGVPSSAVPSHDEQSYAYVKAQDGVDQIFVHEVGDASTRQVTDRATVSGGSATISSDIGWSHDGARLAFGSGNAVWVVPVDGTAEPRRVTPEGVVAGNPSWSPDNLHLAFRSEEGSSPGIWAVNTVTGERRELTDRDGFEWMPRWSPDGRKIAFYSVWDGQMTDIHTVDVETLEIEQITNSPAEDFFPLWTPDSQRIIFASRRDNRGTKVWQHDLATGVNAVLLDDIVAVPQQLPASGNLLLRGFEPDRHLYRIALATGAIEQVTQPPFSYREPAPSLGGDLVAVVTSGVGPEDTVALMSPAGETRVTFGDGLARQRNPAFSPDGRWLAYLSGGGGWRDTNDIWLAGVDGGQPSRLTTQGYLHNVVWCGGNGELVFSGRTDGFGILQLWRGSVDSPDTIALLATDHDLIASDCTPDGRQVVYTAYTPEGPRMRVLDLDTLRSGPVEGLSDEGEGLRYSPDGARVAFRHRPDGASHSEIYIQQIGGGRPVRLTDSPLTKSWPAWSRTGDSLWFSGDATTSTLYSFDTRSLPR